MTAEERQRHNHPPPWSRKASRCADHMMTQPASRELAARRFVRRDRPCEEHADCNQRRSRRRRRSASPTRAPCATTTAPDRSTTTEPRDRQDPSPASLPRAPTDQRRVPRTRPAAHRERKHANADVMHKSSNARSLRRSLPATRAAPIRVSTSPAIPCASTNLQRPRRQQRRRRQAHRRPEARAPCARAEHLHRQRHQPVHQDRLVRATSPLNVG